MKTLLLACTLLLTSSISYASVFDSLSDGRYYMYSDNRTITSINGDLWDGNFIAEKLYKETAGLGWNNTKLNVSNVIVEYLNMKSGSNTRGDSSSFKVSDPMGVVALSGTNNYSNYRGYKTIDTNLQNLGNNIVDTTYFGIDLYLSNIRSRNYWFFNIDNSNVTNKVPEPQGIVLVFLGLIGIYTLSRSKQLSL